MVEAKQKNDWGHTAAIMALTANCHRDPKKRRQPFSPTDFDPTLPEPPRERTKDLSILKTVFVDS